MAEALNHPNWRVSIDDPYHKAVFIKTIEFSDPVRKSSNLFLQVLRIVSQRFLVELFL
jgi:non-homologous end joining protein Ku